LDALFGIRAPIMRYLFVDDLTEVMSASGDTILVGGVHFFRTERVTRTARFTFVQREGAVLLASVDGLVDELCRISVS